MALSTLDVINLARLAHFEVTPEEVERFRVQLNAVLEKIAELENAAVIELPENRDPLRLREDIADPAAPPGIAQLSQHVVDGFFTVPRALPPDGNTP